MQKRSNLIKPVRVWRQLSQAELGQLIGKSAPWVSMAERDQLPVSPAIRKLLATALDVPESQLFGAERTFTEVTQ